MRRFGLICGTCGHEWKPRGQNYSAKCPKCASEFTVFTQPQYFSCFTATLLIVVCTLAAIYVIGSLRNLVVPERQTAQPAKTISPKPHEQTQTPSRQVDTQRKAGSNLEPHAPESKSASTPDGPITAGEYGILGQQSQPDGQVHFVWIHPVYSRNLETIERAIDDCDRGSNVVKIFFWTNRNLVPERLPMTISQIRGQVASYQRDRGAGHEQFAFMRNGRMIKPFGRRPSDLVRDVPEVTVKTKRQWKDKTGSFRVNATFVSAAFGTVKLRKEDGSEIEVSIDELSIDDQTYIKSLAIR